MSVGDAVARLPRPLLVVVDFDGTLSEIVSDPAAAVPTPGALQALARLAGTSGITVAVVSGRRLADLRRLIPIPGLTLVGEHGAAWDGVSVDRPAGYDEMAALLDGVAARHPGAWVEAKELSLVLHTRAVEDESAVVADAARALAGHPEVTFGKRVVDVGLVAVDKGLAVAELRSRCAADAVFFAGDDTTDETVFAGLGPIDVGVKVGPGPTAARFRVDGPREVVTLLEQLRE
ncbi:MAG: trehalose-phosphatase [Acidimicrobiia bacterium]|nr:trehalose-phosphatase [Acidimicrobiia bacterium]